MKVWGVSIEDVHEALATVNRIYAGNIRFKREPEETGRAVSFTLTVNSSRGAGARRGQGGRRIAAACWHVHRDIYFALYNVNPGARIQTAIADYRGYVDFSDQCPSTGYINIGSQASPLYACDACECDDMLDEIGAAARIDSVEV